MSTGPTWQIESTSLSDTLALAGKIGRELRGGEIVELVSDLGGGKTAFVRGLAKGMGSTDAVRSPSFTLSNQYRAGKLALYHYDFYRLQEAGILRDELAEAIDDPEVVVAVEWGEIVGDVLPANRLRIKITSISETSRNFQFSYPKELAYLLAGVEAEQ